MIVAELIEKLKEMPQDADVVRSVRSYDETHEELILTASDDLLQKDGDSELYEEIDEIVLFYPFSYHAFDLKALIV